MSVFDFNLLLSACVIPYGMCVSLWFSRGANENIMCAFDVELSLSHLFLLSLAHVRLLAFISLFSSFHRRSVALVYVFGFVSRKIRIHSNAPSTSWATVNTYDIWIVSILSKHVHVNSNSLTTKKKEKRTEKSEKEKSKTNHSNTNSVSMCFTLFASSRIINSLSQCVVVS